MFVLLALPLFILLFGYLLVQCLWLLTPSGRKRWYARALGATSSWWELPVVGYQNEALARSLGARGSPNHWSWVLWTGWQALVGLLFSAGFLFVLMLILTQQ